MIYVIASQQDLHLAQLFKIEELMGRKDIAEKCQHINFGMVMGTHPSPFLNKTSFFLT